MAVYQDFDLNFGIHPIKKDLVTVQDETAILRSIQNLLFTNHYERPFRPELGCNIRGLLFENATQSTAQTIQRFIKETINNFEPRVRIDRLEVTSDEDKNLYNIRLDFFIDVRATPFTASFVLERLR